MTDRLTRADIERLARLHAETTAGPWEAELDLPHDAAIRVPGIRYIVLLPTIGKPETPEQEAQLRADYEFIAAAHEAVPRLIADLWYWKSAWASTVKADCILMHGGSIVSCPQQRCDCALARTILEENPCP